MANDRGILTHLRRWIDAAAGAGMAHTLAFRLPELLALRREHFQEDLSPAQQRRLFASAVRYVEIETHSYCNRTCWFCPNTQVDRRSVRHYLPETTFVQILRDLASIGYRRRLGFSRYNEPFADDVIFDRLTQTRCFLSRARIQIYSNGDFLTSKMLQRLDEIGAKDLVLGVYLPNEMDWSPTSAERFLARLARRLDIRLAHRREAPGERISYQARLGGVHIDLFCPNYAAQGIDRGGAVNGVPLSTSPRRSPCLYPLTRVHIDFNGSMMPCCHLRSDIASHAESALGVVDDRPGSIFSVWGSNVAARCRKSLACFSVKGGPCKTCTAQPWSESTLGRRIFEMGLRMGWAR